ncbi:class I SAM-dependent methyltransferase [Agathobaculum sp.]|uniref:class I SAM-dependent methyltransferase n=1 Tax=Agathobaculum sp. TaxID=2048138 RepID=UPI0027BAFAA6|nr:SAM-dependent methyltransferase [Agathobaculum sp.]MBS6641474.1 SAM-dependent methyltransferase [Clostridiaceae bacterium]
MQKGDLAKLRLLLSGIAARLDKNRDYFVQADCTFTSGKKKFPAKLTRAEENYVLRFQGSTRPADADSFCAFFIEQAEKFDESMLVYTERSTVVALSVTARGVQMKQAEREATAEEKSAAANPLLDSGRQYLIRVDQAAALLREIGILTAEGKLKNDMIRKYNQIDHYVELVAPMFEKDDSEEIVLLDCACGKSYLSFVMNYYLHEVLRRRCRVIGVDINEHVIEESRAMAKRLGYHNMVFQCADLRTYQPPKNVTAVISLHACDIATDLALSTAIRARAKYIACVPCCHKELLDQYTLPGLEPLTKFGVFKARFNDVLTDSMRALKLEAEGYKVSVVEYISPLDTPKNLLIRAVRTGQDNLRARQEYNAVRRVLGTTSELDRRCAELENEFFVTDEDLLL